MASAAVVPDWSSSINSRCPVLKPLLLISKGPLYGKIKSTVALVKRLFIGAEKNAHPCNVFDDVQASNSSLPEHHLI